jgi:hypothetical protein
MFKEIKSFIISPPQAKTTFNWHRTDDRARKIDRIVAIAKIQITNLDLDVVVLKLTDSLNNLVGCGGRLR